MEEVIILTDFPLKKGCNVTIVILQNDKHLLTINKSNNNYTATWQKWKWAAMMWCLRSVRKTRSERRKCDSARRLCFFKYRVPADDRISSWQFIDHQHHEAAVSLNQSNHQVHFLFVRACINMYFSLRKTLPEKQPWPPSKSRFKFFFVFLNRWKQTNILCS